MPSLVVDTSYFNAKSKNWNFDDSTASQGNVLDNIKSQFGLKQVIKKPTHILNNSPSCIDTLFSHHSQI